MRTLANLAALALAIRSLACVSPDNSSPLTLNSGLTFDVLTDGMLFEEGKTAYTFEYRVTDLYDSEKRCAEAVEIWEYVRPKAEEQDATLVGILITDDRLQLRFDWPPYLNSQTSITARFSLASDGTWTETWDWCSPDIFGPS